MLMIVPRLYAYTAAIGRSSAGRHRRGGGAPNLNAPRGTATELEEAIEALKASASEVFREDYTRAAGFWGGCDLGTSRWTAGTRGDAPFLGEIAGSRCLEGWVGMLFDAQTHRNAKARPAQRGSLSSTGQLVPRSAPGRGRRFRPLPGPAVGGRGCAAGSQTTTGAHAPELAVQRLPLGFGAAPARARRARLQTLPESICEPGADRPTVRRGPGCHRRNPSRAS